MVLSMNLFRAPEASHGEEVEENSNLQLTPFCDPNHARVGDFQLLLCKIMLYC